MSDSFVARQKLIEAVVESTKGTEATTSAAAAATTVYDPKCVPGDIFSDGEREPSAASSGTVESVKGMQSGTMTFTTDLVFNDYFMTLIKACGYSVTGSGPFTAVPTLDQATQKTLTLAVWEGGRKKVLYGASGNVVIKSAGAAQRVQCDWEFQGIFKAVTDQAMPSDPTQSAKGWRNQAITLTLAAAAIPEIDGFEINAGANVEVREDATQAAGILHYLVTQVKPTLSLQPQADLVANYDAFGKFLAGTAEALSLVLTDANSKTMTITAPKVQRISIGDEERGGKLIDPIECMCHISSGNDQIQFVESA